MELSKAEQVIVIGALLHELNNATGMNVDEFITEEEAVAFQQYENMDVFKSDTEFVEIYGNLIRSLKARTIDIDFDLN